LQKQSGCHEEDEGAPVRLYRFYAPSVDSDISRDDSLARQQRGCAKFADGEEKVPLSQMQQRLYQTFRHEDALSVPVREGTAIRMSVLHEEGQVLVEHVRARAANAQ